MFNKSPYTFGLYTHRCDIIPLHFRNTLSEIVGQPLDQYEQVPCSQGTIRAQIREAVWKAIHGERHVSFRD